jgi:glutamate 5-kinase
MDAFGWKERPTLLKDKQAAAAVGQVALMEAYKTAFAPYGTTIAQILLTRSDLDDRERYLNIRNTLTALLDRGVIPIINENDTVATQEINSATTIPSPPSWPRKWTPRTSSF